MSAHNITRTEGGSRWRRIGVMGLVCCGLAGVQAQPTEVKPALSLLEALGRTLNQNTGVRLQQRQVEVARSIRLQAAGSFDPVLGSTLNAAKDEQPINSVQRAQAGLGLLQTDTQSLSLRAGQLMMNGWSWTGSYSSSRTTGTLNDLSQLAPQNQGRLDFALVVPLGRAAGLAAKANLQAADLEVQAARHDLQHTVSQSALNTIVGYWGLVAAQRNLGLATEAERSLLQLRNEVEKLVAADELPAAELNLIQANLIDKRAQRLAAERFVLDAKVNLGRSMGLAAGELSGLRSVDDFPGAPVVPALNAAVIAQLAQTSLEHRADLAAARVRSEATLLVREAALRNLKPKLDVRVNVGVAGLYEGSRAISTLLAPVQGTPGNSIGLALQYEWPVGNQTSRGVLEQQNAVLDQREIQIQDLRNAIGAGVHQAAEAVHKAAQQIQASTDSLELYQKTLDNEKTKHRLGQATLIQVLNVNDLLIAARAAMVGYLANYYSAVARLRFEMGKLIEQQGDQGAIALDQIMTVPAQGRNP